MSLPPHTPWTICPLVLFPRITSFSSSSGPRIKGGQSIRFLRRNPRINRSRMISSSTYWISRSPGIWPSASSTSNLGQTLSSRPKHSLKLSYRTALPRPNRLSVEIMRPFACYYEWISRVGDHVRRYQRALATRPFFTTAVTKVIAATTLLHSAH